MRKRTINTVVFNFTQEMPGNGCVVPGCKNRSYKPDCTGLTFHSFPKDNPELLSEWLIKMRLSLNINDNSRVCSEHFIDGKTRKI